MRLLSPARRLASPAIAAVCRTWRPSLLSAAWSLLAASAPSAPVRRCSAAPSPPPGAAAAAPDCAAGDAASDGSACMRDCWSCGACTLRRHLFCGTCEYIQPIEGGGNYFQLLGMCVRCCTGARGHLARNYCVHALASHLGWRELVCAACENGPATLPAVVSPALTATPSPTPARSPQRVDLDISALEAAYKSLQRAVHPDLFGTRSAAEQALSARASASVNIGYLTLRAPVSRAQYLLQLRGVDALGEAAVRSVAPGLLLEVMEGREALEDARPANAPRVRAVREAAARRLCETRSAVAAHYAAARLQPAADAVVERQYLTKLEEEAAEWMLCRREEEERGAGGGGRGG